MPTTPNYKKLYEQTLQHLRCVSGSRNSFTPEVIELLWGKDSKITKLRSDIVEDFHSKAAEFLRQHDIT